jgi:hypothetical protein
MCELHLYDQSDSWIRLAGIFDHIDDQYYLLQDKGTWAAPVRSIDDVGKRIETFGKFDGPIEDLIVHTHGNVGYIHLPDGGITAANVGRLRSFCIKYFARPTHIRLLGCNVAESDEGKEFLRQVAKNMLGHCGGTVVAYASKTYSIVGLGQYAPTWGDKVTVAIDTKGNLSLKSEDVPSW